MHIEKKSIIWALLLMFSYIMFQLLEDPVVAFSHLYFSFFTFSVGFAGLFLCCTGDQCGDNTTCQCCSVSLNSATVLFYVAALLVAEFSTNCHLLFSPAESTL